jgi:hypothetical protein
MLQLEEVGGHGETLAGRSWCMRTREPPSQLKTERSHSEVLMAPASKTKSVTPHTT